MKRRPPPIEDAPDASLEALIIGNPEVWIMRRIRNTLAQIMTAERMQDRRTQAALERALAEYTRAAIAWRIYDETGAAPPNKTRRKSA